MKEKIEINDILEGNLHVNKSGSGYFVSDNIKKDIYIHKSNTNKGLHLDKVVIEVFKGKDRALEGRVIEIIHRFKTKFVGTIQVSDRFAFLVPDSQKMSTDIFIPIKKLNGAKDGQKVVVELTKWEENRKTPNGKVIEVLGDSGDNDAEIHAILEEYDLPYKFNADVEAESEMIPLTISDEEIEKRLDMRDVLTYTIDPDTAKDFDDALSFERNSNGNYNVGIHIADVSHYVRPGTELDREAYERGTSVYLVDRVVPMLPERLSNGVCSLRPHEDKLCFSAIFEITEGGEVVQEWFGRTVIHSNHRFTYGEAQEIIENDGKVSLSLFETSDNKGYVPSTNLMNQLCDSVMKLDKIAKTLRKKRHEDGSISFDKREIKFKLDENNKPVDVLFSISKDANKLIEEFMLLANRKVAIFLNSKNIPSVNRLHDEPDLAKLNILKDFIVQFGYNVKLDNPDELRSNINKLLSDVKGTPEENIVNNLVIRSMQKAVYSTRNDGHYGLGFEDYTHFTSPIRRYPDVMIHRILNRVLKGYSPHKEVKLMTKCQYLSNREVKAQKASRDSVKFKQCEFMMDNIGKVYDGTIVGVTNYGLFVEIQDTNCEGFVNISEISGDTYNADLTNFCVVGYNTGEVIRLGDEVTIIIKDVDILKKNIDLNLLKL